MKTIRTIYNSLYKESQDSLKSAVNIGVITQDRANRQSAIYAIQNTKRVWVDTFSKKRICPLCGESTLMSEDKKLCEVCRSLKKIYKKKDIRNIVFKNDQYYLYGSVIPINIKTANSVKVFTRRSSVVILQELKEKKKI